MGSCSTERTVCSPASPNPSPPGHSRPLGLFSSAPMTARTFPFNVWGQLPRLRNEMMRPDQGIPNCLPETPQKPRRGEGRGRQLGLHGTSPARAAQRICSFLRALHAHTQAPHAHAGTRTQEGVVAGPVAPRHPSDPAPSSCEALFQSASHSPARNTKKGKSGLERSIRNA